ncbi:hypothetical protein BOTBODRAFT_163600 [Botryobasidium botryosum FD-172 SS1]|uniref:Uncharacterized protein n=1 Tax=Botryobasidium botryosum (strain FD-172 SS1) TaxID=930990 RepID=A0A067M7P1_BOTB1|nr:hypothetical protein BOTBODRAFT_163600 [Botryobasidium botryosum FD-172 SS1]
MSKLRRASNLRGTRPARTGIVSLPRYSVALSRANSSAPSSSSSATSTTSATSSPIGSAIGTPCTPQTQSPRAYINFISNPPPDSPYAQYYAKPSKGKGKSPEDECESRNISDREWELRIGRAIFVLQRTLPDFFTTGLVMTSAVAPGEPGEPIYSKAIRLTYMPPVRLPAPFPQTLHIEGLSLYQASAVVLRTSLTTLYSDCHVELTRTNVVSSGRRERKAQIALCMVGQNRVSGARAEWNVDATYTFSPLSGLVYRHEIESIRPAPHIAFYDMMRASLHRLIGEGSTPGIGGVGGGKVTTSDPPQVK